MDKTEAIAAFAALSQSARLDAFRLLVQAGDEGMLAGDIARAVDVRQNTMSTNLSVLLRAGLIANHRQGRTVRYVADMEGLKGLLGFLLQDCCGGQVEQCAPLIDSLTNGCDAQSVNTQKTYNVLFLCHANSARSLMAEAILQREGTGRFRAFSAGSSPAARANPNTLALLARNNFDVGAFKPKSWDVFSSKDAPKMDFVITVCDKAAGEPCPTWPGQPVTTHWGVHDPAAFEGNEAHTAVIFNKTYAQLRSRISGFANLPIDSLDQLALKRQMDAIGGITADLDD